MISKGRKSLEPLPDISEIKDIDLVRHYLGITKVPCLINSPLREDSKPSFALYSPNNLEINYKDFSTGDGGNIVTLLSKIWNCSIYSTKLKIHQDYIDGGLKIENNQPVNLENNSEIQCKIREWRNYDIKYWNSFGVSLDILKFADIYPISHKIIIKDNRKHLFVADKYAYVFVERKENNISLKIYQPFNTNGYKWTNKQDKSVLNLWTKLPNYGDKICICASVKDALCLWNNIKIPSIALQGEGFPISKTAINELKKRFKSVYICLDNDNPGIAYSTALSEETGFTNIILPKFQNGKDISDLYKEKGLKDFIQITTNLFK